MRGQERLKESSALIVGAGGLGSPASIYLAAAGVGRIGLVDFDEVDESNLHRQILFGESDIGRQKLDAAKERLAEINPHITVDVYPTRLSASNAHQIISDYDIVADGSDNFETRYLVNDACVLSGTPNAYASISRFAGQASVFCAPGGPCYRCVFPEPPPAHLVPSCGDAGVLGVLPGLLGTIQATEVLKLLLGIGESLVGRLLLVDSLAMLFRSVDVSRDPDCPVCSQALAISHGHVEGETLHSAASAAPVNSIPEISVQAYKSLRESESPPFLLDVRDPEEASAANLDLGGTLIPLAELPSRVDELVEYMNDEMLVVHCQMGGRAEQAVQFLRRNGFHNVVNLKGGMLAWMAENGPTATDD